MHRRQLRAHRFSLVNVNCKSIKRAMMIPFLGRIIISGWLAWFVASSVAHSGEPKVGWPQWRGSTFDGISTETDLAETWPESGPPVLWSRELGQGYSSFIAVGERIFTQTQTLYEQAVICLDAGTGKTVWSARYGWPYEGGGLYPGPRSTPTWSKGRIYFAAPDGTIGCLDAISGGSIWSANPTKQFHGRGTDFGYACSPVVIDGKVIVPVGGIGASIVALSAQDGSVVWKSGDSSASYASPLPIEWKGRKLVVALLENSLAVFDLKTGELVCENTFSTDYDEHSAAPLYREPLLMMAGAFRSGGKCIRLEKAISVGDESKLSFTQVWDAPKFSNDVASSVLYGGHVYGFDLRDAQSRVNRPSRGEYRCLEFETGRILWSTDKVGHANTIVADGKLILFNDKGEVILARAGNERYEELARATVFHDQICWSPAALHRGRLYLRTQTQAVCLYLGNRPLKSSQPVKSVAEIPRVSAFDPTPLLGGEREFPATVPEWPELCHWYLWSLAGLGLSFLLSLSIYPAVWIWRFLGERANREVELAAIPTSEAAMLAHRSTDRIRIGSQCIFWLTAIVIGATFSPLLNRWRDEYVFLWPIIIWSSLQLTVVAITWAERQTNRLRARWISFLAGLGFLAVSGLYFHLCRRLGLSIEWGFLTGYLPAFPVTAIAARGLLRQPPTRHQWLIELICVVGSFTAYFGGAALFLKWWLRLGS